MKRLFKEHGINVCASELLRCAVLGTSLYHSYYLDSCVPCALNLISLDHLFRVP
jgi:hypothetical protein